VLLGLGRVGTVLSSATLQATSLSTGAVAWLYVAGAGYDSAVHPVTAAHYFGDLACWPTLAAALTIAAVGPITGVRRVELAGHAGAGLVAAYGVLLPVMDNEPTGMTATMLAASAAWVVALIAAPRRFHPVALLPFVGTLAIPAVAAVGLAAEAVRALTS